MSSIVTVERMRALYDTFRDFPPFDRWELPPAADIKFSLTDDLEMHGGYNTHDDGSHEILLNPYIIQSLRQLVLTMLHEMVHMRQEMNGKRPAVKDSSNNQHNKEFYRLQRLVCRELLLDPERF